METIKTICCAAGKSGGHIIPNLQIAHNYTQQEKRILFFSDNTPLDYTLLANNREIEWHIPLNLCAPRWYSIPLFAIRLLSAVFKSLYQLYKHKPEVILSTGGITAVPVCLAGLLLGIPIELFELNATPGVATQWLAPLATTINVCFKKTIRHLPDKKTKVASYPVRHFKMNTERQIFADLNKRIIFIQGGSQGSVSLNKKVKAMLEAHPELCNQIAIIHQTGSTDQFDWHSFYREKNIPAIVFAFQDDIADYYQAADLIICRAGAGQLFEAVHFGKPFITIPLELANNTHQVENACAMQEEYPDLCTVVRQKNDLYHAIKLKFPPLPYQMDMPTCPSIR